MKSPLRNFIIRLMTNASLIVAVGMYIHVILTEQYPNLILLWHILSLLLIVLCCFLLYHIAWKWGERDRNLVKYNHLTYQPKRGFIAGGCAVILPLVSMILLVLNRPGFVKYIYITVIIGIPFLTGYAYLNGHKLKSTGINIIYRKKKKK